MRSADWLLHADTMARFRQPERTVLVPLAWYLVFTLGFPLLNGAGQRPGFWSHAATVLVTSGSLALLLLGVGAVLRRRRASPRARH
jgi:uncharacterized protein (TIGR03382 family)